MSGDPFRETPRLAALARATRPGAAPEGPTDYGSGPVLEAQGGSAPGSTPGGAGLGGNGPGPSSAASPFGTPLQSSNPGTPQPEEACDLCAQPVPPRHRHLLDVETGELQCVCRACSLLFDRKAAGGGHYRLVPDRARRVEGFVLDDATWEELAIPVGLAYFYHCSREERVRAFYPAPMGATESLLGLDAWTELEAANPVLRELEPDVEALLVRRIGADREHWLVPIDCCYRLVAVLRTHWKGLGGGPEVWKGIAEFFDELDRQARRVDREGRRL